MAVTSFQDLPLADRDREWDGDAAENRVREWAGAEDEPTRGTATPMSGTTPTRRNFTAYKLLSPTSSTAGSSRPARRDGRGNVMVGGRGGVDLPPKDVDRAKSHLSKYYAKMGDKAPGDRDRQRQRCWSLA